MLGAGVATPLTGPEGLGQPALPPAKPRPPPRASESEDGRNLAPAVPLFPRQQPLTQRGEEDHGVRITGERWPGFVSPAGMRWLQAYRLPGAGGGQAPQRWQPSGGQGGVTRASRARRYSCHR
jgi:hypothetical protein